MRRTNNVSRIECIGRKKFATYFSFYCRINERGRYIAVGNRV